MCRNCEGIILEFLIPGGQKFKNFLQKRHDIAIFGF